MFLNYWSRPPIIDEAELRDADALAEIHASGFARPWSAEEFAAFLRRPEILALAARRAGPGGSRRPIAFILLRRAADEAEVLTIAVAPRHRHRGIARQLLQAALRHCYEERIGAVFLEVDAGNDAALALYRRLEFREIGRRMGYYRSTDGPPSAALVMRRDLR